MTTRVSTLPYREVTAVSTEPPHEKKNLRCDKERITLDFLFLYSDRTSYAASETKITTMFLSGSDESRAAVYQQQT